jgi:hypothetical protein
MLFLLVVGGTFSGQTWLLSCCVLRVVGLLYVVLLYITIFSKITPILKRRACIYSY